MGWSWSVLGVCEAKPNKINVLKILDPI